MSQHQFFRRAAVPAQVATKQETITFPAPTRGLILSENESYMQPGAALVMDNWAPTMKGAKIRGGCDLWADLHPDVFTSVTWDPATVALVTLSNGNRTATCTSTSATQGAHVAFVNGKTSGKYYFEITRTTVLSSAASSYTFGVGTITSVYGSSGISVGVTGVMTSLGGNIISTVATGKTIPSGSTGDVVGVAVDLDNRMIWFKKLTGASSPSGWNNVTANSNSPITNVGGVSIPGGSTAVVPWATFGGIGTTIGDVQTANFGATAFVGAVPTGFVAGWGDTGPATPREPLISAFEYASGIVHKMFFADETRVYDVSTSTATVVASGRTSGNYAASQMANAAGDFLMVVNDAGDFPLRYDGTTWTILSAGEITGPVGSVVVAGAGLTYVCKYRNRYFFIERNSMNAWYLPLNAIQGALSMIPLSGAATKGGKLLFCTSWSIDAGDGIDDKIVFVTDQGEAIIFTGSDPASAANWRQEGRYMLSPPMGMNAHLSIGGDLLVATVDGILPMSGAITKDRAELELAAVTRSIKPMWRAEVLDKRDQHWTMFKWDEYGGVFTTFPGGLPGNYVCLATNAATGAHARYTGWDAMCFAQMRGDAFFGTQTGQVMQMDRTGYDNGAPYLCTLVGGWEVFQSPSQTITWKQARASFSARGGEPFVPQLGGTTDYVVTLPTPPSAAPDPGVLDLWDQGVWDDAVWDAGTPSTPVVRNTGWVSIGVTGFSHAPVVQVQMAQQAKPEVELISIAGVFERLAITI